MTESQEEIVGRITELIADASKIVANGEEALRHLPAHETRRGFPARTRSRLQRGQIAGIHAWTIWTSRSPGRFRKSSAKPGCREFTSPVH